MIIDILSAGETTEFAIFEHRVTGQAVGVGSVATNDSSTELQTAGAAD